MRKRPYVERIDLKGTGNRVTKHRRNVEVETGTDYSRGEKSPYREWAQDLEKFDNVNPDMVPEGSQPWDLIPASDGIEAQFEILQELILRGRQNDIRELLYAGVTNQSEMARLLKIDQREVVVHLRRIAKKILKKCMENC